MNIINILEWKKKKHLDELLARGRTPLYVSHATGKITGPGTDNADFGTRLERIRVSLDKINRLMASIKEMNAEVK